MDCSALDQLFQTLNARGVYRVTIVSNQPDGIVGFGGTYGSAGTGGSLLMRAQEGQPKLAGSTDKYLLSDRTFNLPSSGPFVGDDQPFSVAVSEPIGASVIAQGGGQYLVELDFTGPINRQFSIEGQCIGGAIVGTAPAIGNSENIDSAVYVVTVGGFTEDPK